MNISMLYDINRIVIDLEVILQIDGSDYAIKDVDEILKNVKKRIIRQYQVDLSDVKMTNQSLYMGKSRNSATLFLENVARLHGQLCGYLQVARYTGYITVKPINVNFLGFEDKSLMGFLQYCMREKTIPSINDAIEAVKRKIGSIDTCIEKKLFLILVVSYELGFLELMASVAEILYLGGKV